MRSKITLLFLFISLIANANFIQGKILFNDGHTETGFINSFLENKFSFDPLNINSLEHTLNLDDKTLKFKSTEDGEIKTVSFDDIDEVTIIHENDIAQEFKVLYLKGIDKKGMFIDSDKKVCLPLVKRGKVNIYGFTYKNTYYDGKYYQSSREVAYYYQNDKENYAFNYYDIDIQDMFTIKQRIANPLIELFKDCPVLTTYIHNGLLEPSKLSKEEKTKMKEDQKSMAKILKKEAKDIPQDVMNGNLEIYHKYNFSAWDDMINRYNNDDCK